MGVVYCARDDAVGVESAGGRLVWQTCENPPPCGLDFMVGMNWNTQGGKLYLNDHQNGTANATAQTFVLAEGGGA